MTSKNQLRRSTPESQGIALSAILAFVEDVETNIHSLHSLMLMRHGHVVAEGWWSPYAPEYPHVLFSLSKSFTSTAVGLAVAEGHLSVDDPVLSFFPDDAPAAVSENLAAMRVRHLLSMSTGHAEDTTDKLFAQPDGNWVRGFLACPVEHVPGTHFLYNTGASYMLSAIVHKITGQRMLHYLQERLFEPLGIEGATWETCPRGIDTGGFGLSVKTEDIARFGQLYLQKGMWHGRRILPEAWVAEATARQVSNAPNENPDWEQGYGYQFWRCRHGIYRGDGAFGQYCVVMPDQDAVLAMTGGLGNMQAVLDRVWQHLLPAMDATSLPENCAAHDELARKLASLSMPPAQGRRSSPVAAQVSGKAYALEANDQGVEAISLTWSAEGCLLTVRDKSGEHRVACGSGTWLKGTTTLDSPGAKPVAASSAWTADDTYTIQLCFYETPFCPTIICRFAGDKLTYDFKPNVGFGPLERPQLVGRMA